MTSPPSPQPKQWKNRARGVDVERRRLLVVEGAQALQGAAAGVAERDVLRDDVVDARLLAHLGDVLLADPSCHVAILCGRSVLAGHDVHKLVAGGVAVQLVAHQAVRARPHRAARAADVRGDEQVGCVPERVVLGQRLDVGDVGRVVEPSRRAARPPRASVSTTAPRATLTSSAPSFIAARKPASTRPRVSSVRGTTSTTTSASGSRRGSSAIGWTPSRGAPRDPHHLDLERQQPPLDGLADRAVPDDQHAPVGERGVPAGAATGAGPGRARSRARRAGWPGSA